MKAVVWFLQCLMAHACRSMKNSDVLYNLTKCGGLNRARDWSFDILVKKVDAFFPYLKCLPEVKVNSFVLISTVEEI